MKAALWWDSQLLFTRQHDPRTQPPSAIPGRTRREVRPRLGGPERPPKRLSAPRRALHFPKRTGSYTYCHLSCCHPCHVPGELLRILQDPASVFPVTFPEPSRQLNVSFSGPLPDPAHNSVTLHHNCLTASLSLFRILNSWRSDGASCCFGTSGTVPGTE